MTPAISVAGLSRRYHGQLALDQVSFDIEPGSITGLLGRNGTGKSVTGLWHSLWCRTARGSPGAHARTMAGP